jgi:hypothetical protein
MSKYRSVYTLKTGLRYTPKQQEVQNWRCPNVPVTVEQFLLLAWICSITSGIIMSEAWQTLVACNVKCTHYMISCKGSQRSPTNINWLQEVLESASLKIASTTANKKVARCQKIDCH